MFLRHALKLLKNRKYYLGHVDDWEYLSDDNVVPVSVCCCRLRSRGTDDGFVGFRLAGKCQLRGFAGRGPQRSATGAATREQAGCRCDMGLFTCGFWQTFALLPRLTPQPCTMVQGAVPIGSALGLQLPQDFHKLRNGVAAYRAIRAYLRVQVFAAGLCQRPDRHLAS